MSSPSSCSLSSALLPASSSLLLLKMPAGASSSSSSSSVSSSDPARKRFVGGYSSEEVSSSDSSSSSEDSTPSQDQASSLLFASSSPLTRNCRLSSPSVRDASSSDQTAKSQSLSSHHCGAKVLYAAMGGCSGVGSRSLMLLEAWEDRPEEAEEAMAEKEGFFGRGGRRVFSLLLEEDGDYELLRRI